MACDKHSFNEFIFRLFVWLIKLTYKLLQKFLLFWHAFWANTTPTIIEQFWLYSINFSLSILMSLWKSILKVLDTFWIGVLFWWWVCFFSNFPDNAFGITWLKLIFSFSNLYAIRNSTSTLFKSEALLTTQLDVHFEHLVLSNLLLKT